MGGSKKGNSRAVSPLPGKSQVTLGFLRNTGTNLLRAAIGPKEPSPRSNRVPLLLEGGSNYVDD